jgi:hypothetical protein
MCHEIAVRGRSDRRFLDGGRMEEMSIPEGDPVPWKRDSPEGCNWMRPSWDLIQPGRRAGNEGNTK